MCLKNRSYNSASYLNAQLTGLWDNAKHCANDSDHWTQRTGETELGTCLYQTFDLQHFDHPSIDTAKFSFHAKFGKPSIEFVCNHEIILKLTVTEGHYNPHPDDLHCSNDM